MSRPKVKRPADMSKPPEERGRRRQQGPVGGTPPAQMSHALGSRGARWRRDGENKFAATEGLRADAARFQGELAGLDEESFAGCALARSRDEAGA